MCLDHANGHHHDHSHHKVVEEEPAKGTKFAVTTPLYYVNASPHMGSAYPTIAVDALARFYRMIGLHPVFVTGCDEHGEKILQAATKAGREPQDHCDLVSEEFRNLWTKLDIKYDRFIRTTSPRHEQIVKEFMERVWNNGDIYKAAYEGLYCTGCEEYKDPKDLLPGDMCPLHQAKCDSRKEENYFFKLTNYQDRLEQFLNENIDFIRPRDRRNEVLGWIKSGLRDFSVSRANNPWGIPIPRDPSQTIYVWFDALLGYVSSLLEESDEATLENCMKRGWPANVHVIGKDILRFHAVYWPAMLMSAGLPLPSHVYGHGFLTKDGMKMGKSLGNTLDPEELVDTYGANAVRYYFMKAIEFGRDGDFQLTRFLDICNADLAHSVGNLLNRSLNLLKKNCESTIPMDSMDAASADHPVRVLIKEKVDAARRAYNARDFPEACNSMISIAHEANTLAEREAPWTEFKSGDREKAAQTCVILLEATRIIATGLSPVVPNLARSVYLSLGYTEEIADNLKWEYTEWGMINKGMTFPQPKPLFQKLESPEEKAAAAAVAATAGKAAGAQQPKKEKKEKAAAQ